MLVVGGTVFALHALRGGRVLLWGGSLPGAAAGFWWLWRAMPALA